MRILLSPARLIVPLLTITMIGLRMFAAQPVMAASFGCEFVDGETMAIGGNSIDYALRFDAGETIIVTFHQFGPWRVQFGATLGSIYDSGMSQGPGIVIIYVPVSEVTNFLISSPTGEFGNSFSIECYGIGEDIPPEVLAPGQPVPETWEGSPESEAGNYDGRIDASPADRYAVYCADGWLQVWDGVNGVKVGEASYEFIAALDNPASVAIGENVYLGRSNNVLGVVIPGEYEMLSIDMESCTGGGYEVDG